MGLKFLLSGVLVLCPFLIIRVIGLFSFYILLILCFYKLILVVLLTGIFFCETLCVHGTQVFVLEQTFEESLAGCLEGHDGSA